MTRNNKRLKHEGDSAPEPEVKPVNEKEKQTKKTDADEAWEVLAEAAHKGY